MDNFNGFLIDGSWWIWGVSMTKQEMIKAYQKSLKKIEEDQARFEELGEPYLVGQYNIYIKLLKMFIKDLEKLD